MTMAELGVTNLTIAALARPDAFVPQPPPQNDPSLATPRPVVPPGASGQKLMLANTPRIAALVRSWSGQLAPRIPAALQQPPTPIAAPLVRLLPSLFTPSTRVLAVPGVPPLTSGAADAAPLVPAVRAALTEPRLRALEGLQGDGQRTMAGSLIATSISAFQAGALNADELGQAIEWSIREATGYRSPAPQTQPTPAETPDLALPPVPASPPEVRNPPVMPQPADAQAAVRDLMAAYRLPAALRSERMEAIVRTEIGRAAGVERRLFEMEGVLPPDVADGRASTADLLDRTSSIDKYALYLRANPERFSAIANSTVYAEARFQELAADAGNRGILRQPQIDAIGQEADGTRQAYIAYRTLSGTIDAIQNDWRERPGTAFGSSRATYRDAMSYLSDRSVDPDERTNDRFSDDPNEIFAQQMRAEWGQGLPLGLRGFTARRTLFAKARILDQATAIESRLSIIGRTGLPDSAFLQRTQRTLGGEIDRLQRVAASERSAFQELSPYEAGQALAILQPLKDRIDRALQAP
jgi:hypothetical protein